MNDTWSRRDSLGRVFQPAALATTLALGTLSASCGPAQEVSLPSAQPKGIATKTAPLLGADKAKVVTTAKTIINTYTKLAADAKVGDTTITVADATALGATAGDLVMVIQMQGATIVSTDTGPPNGYGKVSTLNGAGGFEIASVKSVAANVITLNYCKGLKNAYATAAHTQVVRVPQYTTLDVNAGASITAQAWDGDKGGVVAAYVQGKTTLLGDIDASGTGFRGGAKTNGSDDPAMIVTSYRSATLADGGEKGEGIAGSTTDYDKLGGRYGRGAAANGGGGGNSHDGGGGGGANQTNMRDWTGQGVMVVPNGTAFLTAWSKDPGFVGNALASSSGGGRGGYSYGKNSNAVADPLVTGPGSIPIWGGNGRQEVGGLGGHPLSNGPSGGAVSGSTPALYLGGGGGAGNSNDNAGGPGGNGGGIVFLVSGSVEGAGSVVSKGSAGATSKAVTTGDAPSGGGAGGTVVVLSGRTISNNMKLNADGGVGGNQIVGTTESEGPGGGGGGGYIGTFNPTATLAARSAAGAASGVTDSTAVTAFNVNGATFGANGKADDTFTYQDGTTMPVCVPSDLVVTTTFIQGTVAPGNTVLLTVNISNSGPEPAQAVGYGDTLTPLLLGTNATWTCTSTGGAACPAPSGTKTIVGIADLPVQSSLTYVVSVPLPVAFTGPLVYNAVASVPPGFNDLNLANNTSTVTLPLNTVPTADLSVTLTSLPSPAATGTPILYDVAVQNNGPGTATGAAFTYTVPAGSTIQSITAPAGWSCPAPAPQATTLTCTYTPSPASKGVPKGALPDVQITVLPPAGATDIMTSVNVTGQGITDPTTGNNSATNDTMIGNFPVADISVGINSTANPAAPGAPVNYDVRLINSGPSTATGATVSFNVSAGSTIQSFDNTSAGWSCQAVATTVSCTYGQSFAPGAPLDLMFTVLPDPTATSITATARGTGQGVADPMVANNTATDVDLITTAPAQADLVLTVTTAPMPPQAGQPVTYTLDVANKGPADATGAMLTYTIPQGGMVTGITAPMGWSCAQISAQNQVSCWFNGPITANSSAPDVVITVAATDGTTSLSATTTVTPEGAVDPNPGDNMVNTVTALGDLKLAGGGLSCNTTPGNSTPAAGAGLMAALLGLLGVRRRRSQ